MAFLQSNHIVVRMWSWDEGAGEIGVKVAVCVDDGRKPVITTNRM